MSKTDPRAMAIMLAGRCGQMSALATLMADDAKQLGDGTDSAKDILTDSLYLMEELADKIREMANNLEAALAQAQKSPGA